MCAQRIPSIISENKLIQDALGSSEDFFSCKGVARSDENGREEGERKTMRADVYRSLKKFQQIKVGNRLPSSFAARNSQQDQCPCAPVCHSKAGHKL